MCPFDSKIHFYEKISFPFISNQILKSVKNGHKNASPMGSKKKTDRVWEIQIEEAEHA